MKTILIALIALLLYRPSVQAESFVRVDEFAYSGTPDGSAAIAVSSCHFVGACDENNVLRLYKHGRSAPVADLLDLNKDLKPPKDDDDSFRECDIEGAARIEDRIYWIGSHGRNKKKKEHPERQVLFATTVSGSGEKTTLTFFGKPCRTLLAELGKLDGLKLEHFRFKMSQ